MTDPEHDLKPRWRLVHDLNVEALEAQVAALDAALQRANSRIAHYCAACEGAERSRDTYCTDCALVATQADVDARTPDAARDWLADRRAVTAGLMAAEHYDVDGQCVRCRADFPLHHDGCAIAAAQTCAKARGWLEEA